MHHVRVPSRHLAALVADEQYESDHPHVADVHGGPKHQGREEHVEGGRATADRVPEDVASNQVHVSRREGAQERIRDLDRELAVAEHVEERAVEVEVSERLLAEHPPGLDEHVARPVLGELPARPGVGLFVRGEHARVPREVEDQGDGRAQEKAVDDQAAEERPLAGRGTDTCRRGIGLGRREPEDGTQLGTNDTAERDILARANRPILRRTTCLDGVTSSDAVAPFPRVSVLLPCYNAARYLPSCLDSLLAQTYRDFEVVALDDGSRDQTPAILAEYAARDRRIRIRPNETNIGLVRTLNLGIDACRGEYIARMDADDEAEPRRFQTQVAFLDAHPDVDVVSSSFSRIDVPGRLIGHREAFVTLPAACRYVTTFATPVAHGAVMARRDCLATFRYSRDPKALHTEDYELWARLVRAGRRLANLPEPLYRVRISPDSVSAANERVQAQNFVTCVQDQRARRDGQRSRRAKRSRSSPTGSTSSGETCSWARASGCWAS